MSVKAIIERTYLSPLAGNIFEDRYSPETLQRVVELEAKGITLGVVRAYDGSYWARPYTETQYGLGSFSPDNAEDAVLEAIRLIVLGREQWFEWK